MKHLSILALILLLASGCTADISSLLYTVASASEPQPVVGDPVRGEDLFRHGVKGAPACIIRQCQI